VSLKTTQCLSGSHVSVSLHLRIFNVKPQEWNGSQESSRKEIKRKQQGKKKNAINAKRNSKKRSPEHHAISMETQKLQCIEIKSGGGQTKNFLR
jgi:hypothetical protein